MRILTIGPAESTVEFVKREMEIQDDIVLFGMHRVFPFFKNKTGKQIDYWTWGDPDAAIEGLKEYDKGNVEELPTIIVPYWMENTSIFKANCGTSPILKNPANSEFYNRMMKALISKNKVVIIQDAISTKSIKKDDIVFKDPSVRFKRDNHYFGTVPFDRIGSASNWARENKFTSVMLPICFYLEATEVYCLGFDNRGKGINRKINQAKNDTKAIEQHLKKYKPWVEDWKQYHNMNIYSVTEDKFSPINTVMDYKPIGEICKK